LQVNTGIADPVLHHAPVFALGIVLIPVFDTLRVFAVRIWNGRSPFIADKTHIHHLLTRAGFSHSFTTRLICFIHGFILLEVYWLKELKEEIMLAILFGSMLLITAIFKNIAVLLTRRGLFLFLPKK
jgi:UDP-N-acetylmuramyl pentapeptide phosphotransferase/UDP-N-acetylglucosamine-1-phosphate transferase